MLVCLHGPDVRCVGEEDAKFDTTASEKQVSSHDHDFLHDCFSCNRFVIVSVTG